MRSLGRRERPVARFLVSSGSREASIDGSCLDGITAYMSARETTNIDGYLGNGRAKALASYC